MRTKIGMYLLRLTEWEEMLVVQERRVRVSNGMVVIGRIINNYPLTSSRQKVFPVNNEPFQEMYQTRKFGEYSAARIIALSTL